MNDTLLLPTMPAHLKPLTVGAFTSQIKAQLESSFASVCVSGEVGSVTYAGSGHVYFTLKEGTNATLPAVMWKTTAQRHRYGIKEGTAVVVCGKITVYPPQGKYQLTVDALFQMGVGAQDLALRKLKDKLNRLGYFAKERKRPLPAMPRRMAIVTSRSGAAIRDMLEIICRRWPCAELWVVGVRVQGPGACEEIAAALERLNGHDGIDVILLGRGGGSSEDLSAFNEEIVARAIFTSKTPIISAIGHEIDVTIADLVADRRAATPSEAAELATPDLVELMESLNSRKCRMHDLLVARYRGHKKQLQSLFDRRVFRLPLERLREQEHRVDDRDVKLRKAAQTRLRHLRQRLDALAAQLESLSPLNVLARGYSLTRSDGKVVRSIQDVAPGDPVEIVLSDGVLQAEVKSKSEKP